MSTAQAPNLIHKTLGVSADVVDEEQGIVEAYVSGIGNKDSVGDIIQPGAFDKFLKIRKPKGVWSHDWNRPVSKTLEIREVEAGSPELPLKMQLAGIGGLYVKTQFNLRTKEGQDAFENVKFFGEEAEWSIGYQVHEQEYSKSERANLLHVIELYEYSPVLFGANALTSTVSVKVSPGTADSIEYEFEGLDDVQAKAVKAALDVVLKEIPSEDEDETQEESDMAKKNEAGLYEVDLDNGEVKTFRSEEQAQAFLNDCKAWNDAVEAAQEETDGEKAVMGSMEETMGRIFQALRAEYAGMDASVYPVATFESSVIFEQYDYMEGSQSFHQVDYSINSEGEVEFGESSEVELVEVVMAKAALQDAVTNDMIEEVKDAISDLPELAEIAEIAAKAAAVTNVKAGRVLSTKNRSNLESALKAIEDVLDADAAEEAEEKSDAELAIERIEAHVKGGLISEEDAEVMLKALKSGEEEIPAELKDLDDEEIVALKEWNEAVEAKFDEEGIEESEDAEEQVEEAAEELEELAALSDEDRQAVAEWHAATESGKMDPEVDPDFDTSDDTSDSDDESDSESDSDEGSEDEEKSEADDLLSAKEELESIAAYLAE